MRAMTRMWQMLLSAIEEVGQAPNAMMAAEMAVIRLTHVSTLPSPEELVRKLQDTPVPPAPSGGGGGGSRPGFAGGSAPAAGGGGSADASPPMGAPTARGGSGPVAALAQAPETALVRYGSFSAVLELIRANRDVKLLVEVETTLRLVSYSPGRIEFEQTEDAPRDLAARLGSRLQAWTGARWAVSVVGAGGAKTIAEVRDAEQLALEAEAKQHPLVQAVMEAFPGAKIAEIRTPEALVQEAAAEALPEVEDEWDPFEED